MGLDNPLHIAFLVVILLLLFGAKRLPEIGRSLGSGMREFKDSISGDSNRPSLGNGAEHPQKTPTPGDTLPASVAAPPPAPASPEPEPEHQPEPQHQA